MKIALIEPMELEICDSITKDRDRWMARAEKAEAERDVLIDAFSCDGCPVPRYFRGQPLDCGHNGDNCREALLAYAAQRALDEAKFRGGAE